MSDNNRTCKHCTTQYDLKQIERVYGADSAVATLGYCSAACYTKASIPCDESVRVRVVKQILNHSRGMLMLHVDRQKETTWELRQEHGRAFILMLRGTEGHLGFDIYYPETNQDTDETFHNFLTYINNL